MNQSIMDRSVLFVGLACIDIIAQSDGFPTEDTDQRIAELAYRRGGNASNSSVVAAQLLLTAGKKPVEFLGVLAGGIGADTTELNLVRKDLTSHGVANDSCPLAPGVAFPTSVVIVNTRNGSRTILHRPTALSELDVDAFDAATAPLHRYGWIHFEGRSANVAAIEAMVELVRRRAPDTVVSLEVEKARPSLERLLALPVDVFFVSKEFARFRGFTRMEEAVQGLTASVQPRATVVCAWGAEGAAASVANGDGGRRQLLVSPARPPPSGRIVDTLGAGDTFNGVFISGRVCGHDWHRCLRDACRIAGDKIGRRGFTGLPGLDADASATEAPESSDQTFDIQ